MAKELERRFHPERGALSVLIEQWPGGPVEVHTLYLAHPGGCPACGKRAGTPVVLDLDAEIAARVAAAERTGAAVRSSLAKAGWQG